MQMIEISTPNPTIPEGYRVVSAREGLDPAMVVGLGAVGAGAAAIGVIENDGLGIFNHAAAYDPATAFSGFEGFTPVDTSSAGIVANTPEATQLGEAFSGLAVVVGGILTFTAFARNVGGARNALALMSSPFRRRANRPVVTVPIS